MSLSQRGVRIHDEVWTQFQAVNRLANRKVQDAASLGLWMVTQLSGQEFDKMFSMMCESLGIESDYEPPSSDERDAMRKLAMKYLKEAEEQDKKRGKASG